MTKDRKYDEEFGVDMPLNEARERFAKATLEDLDGSAPTISGLEDGELNLIPFGKHEIRRVYHDGEWWFSVVDVMRALTGTDRPNRYWAGLKSRLIEKEGLSELSDEIGQLPLPGVDGKMYRTDVVVTETLLRLIQSVPSPKAEPFKRWLAKVGYERIQESQDPEIAIKRALLTYQLQGRSDDWIEKRIRSIVARKELTAEWKKRGIQEGMEYATLTNIISERTFGMHAETHKKFKGIAKQHNLRDHMTDLELILTMLGETSTKEIARQRDAQGFYENSKAATAGGSIAGGARKQIENEAGRKVVSKTNFLGSNKRVADPQRLTLKSK
jgi:DNA-damage-inducible protein D